MRLMLRALGEKPKRGAVDSGMDFAPNTNVIGHAGRTLRLVGRGGAVEEERLDDHGQEFPRVDQRVVGRPHRFGYAVAVDDTHDILGAESVLLAHDFERGTTTERSFGRGGVEETVFVPRAQSGGEGGY